MEKNYDVVIVGGGILGTSLASLLAKSKLKIALLEAASAQEINSKRENDRPLVLSHSSKVILSAMQVWDRLYSQATPISCIHVSDQGNFGSAKIYATEEGVPFLGYVLPASKLAQAIQATAKNTALIDYYQPVEFSSLQYETNQVVVTTVGETNTIQLRGKLLVAADGQHSAVREFLNINNKVHDYQQVAIICNVTLKRSHQGVAYERFTSQGPLAFLPMFDRQAAVVWTVHKDNSGALLTLSKQQFLSELQKSFGYRLGKLIDCTPPTAISIQLVTVWQQVFPRIVLLGNAVHTLHPVAGQGLNLAFRDMAVLWEILSQSSKDEQDIGLIDTLEQYFKRRRQDQEQIISLTHALVSVFSNSLLPVVLARGASMVTLDRIRWLKKLLTKRTLGLSGKVPRLVCGLSIDA